MTDNELSSELCDAMHNKLCEMGSFRVSRFNFASSVYAAAVSLVSVRLDLPTEAAQDIFTALGKSTKIKVEKVHK